jgi:FAD/FMN-containing dehydrogenase
MTTTAIAPKTVTNVAPVQNNAKRTFSLLDSLRNRNELVDTTVSFHFLDGTSKVQPIRKEFVVTEKGKLRTTNAMVEDLNAIAEDYGATHFSID